MLNSIQHIQSRCWTWRGNLLPPGTFHERRPYSFRERYANDRLVNSIRRGRTAIRQIQLTY